MATVNCNHYAFDGDHRILTDGNFNRGGSEAAIRIHHGDAAMYALGRGLAPTYGFCNRIKDRLIFFPFQ